MGHYDVSVVGIRSRGHGVFDRAARWGAALSALLTLLLALPAYATTYYTYDNLGRITQVVESDGTTTQYTYDANGNITSINRVAGTSVLSIGSVSASSGAVGSSITINGSGFSSIASQDTVLINGVAAQVTYASDNRLVVTIPAGATSGDIEITTQNGSITSSNSFAVVPVSISSFSPASAIAGTVVTINGGGFDPTPANNTVLINSVAATVSSATTTQLQITVPSGATPGHISVTAPLGSATSAGDFFVPASGYTLSQIASVAVLVPGGAGHVFPINNPNQVGVALFDGVAGQRMSMVTTNISTANQYAVFAPDGSTLASNSNSGASVDLPPLPQAGTYAWYYIPSSTPGSATFNLQTDVVGNLPVDGTPTATSLAPGQSATYTFAGTAGQSYNLTLTPFNGTDVVDATVYKPDGSLQLDCGGFQAYYNSNERCEFSLGVTGNYTLRLVPLYNALVASSFNTYVVQDFSATLTAGTPGPGVGVTLVPNQNGSLSFTATANQTLALQLGTASVSPDNTVQFSLSGPVNPVPSNIVGPGSLSDGQTTTYNFNNLSAGTYQVLIRPFNNGSAVSMPAVLANGVTATLAVNGTTSTPFQTYVPGQALYFTFAGTAGQNLGLALTQLALTPSTVGNVSIGIYNPDGSYYTSATCYVGSEPGCQMSLRNLPQTGNYQAVVNPGGQATTELAMTVSQDTTGTLALGSPSTITLNSNGQNGLYTFTLGASQAILLTASSIVTSPANTAVTLYVYDANGNLVQNQSMTQSGSMNLGVLAAGTYTVLVVPNNAAMGSLSVAAQPGSNATLTLDGSSFGLATVNPSQNAYVSFAATAGQSVGVAISNLQFSPSSVTGATMAIYNPDGSQLWTSGCSAGAGCVAGYRGLPQTGTYTITISPNGSATMSFGASAFANVMGTLTPGTPVNLTLSQLGQNAMLSFTATAGQSFALQFAGITTSPANTPLGLQVYNNSNYATVTSTTTTQTATTFNLSNLAAGTYVVWIGPQLPATTSLQVTLQPPQTTPLPTDGTSTNITTPSPGQYAYMTFSATAGQSFDVALTNLALSPAAPAAVNWTITAPDGSTVLNPGSCSTTSPGGCSGGIMTMPQTGMYTVNVLPQGQQTLSFTATVAQNLTGSITPGTTETVNLSELGQEARFAFTVTSGQALAVSLTGISTVPSSNVTTYVGIYTSSGAYVTGIETTSGTAVMNLNLAAGNYILWIGPESPATSTMQLSFQGGVPPAVSTYGSSNNISTSAPGQNAYLTFTANQGDSVNVALTNLALSPGSPNYVSWNVTAPDGSTAFNAGNCYTGTPNTGCRGAMFFVPQTGTYTINVLPQGLQTMSFTAIVAQDLTSTITPGTTQTLNLSQIGENARFAFTLTASQSLAINLTGITTVPSSGVTIYMSVNTTDGTSVSYVAGVESSSGSESLNVNLGPGNYILWIGPIVPATTNAQLSFQ